MPSDELVHKVASMVYGEVGSLGKGKNRRWSGKKHWDMALGSFVNSIDYGEWKNMTPDEILNERFYAVQNKNDPYMEAMSGNFHSDEAEDQFKDIYARTSAALQGNIDLPDTQFFYTPDEVEELVDTGGHDFSLTPQTGKVGKYRTYKYKGFGEEEEKEFDEAFAEARKKGKKTFTWKGGNYTTELAK